MDETFRQSLFQARFRRQRGKDALAVAFDGSTVSTYSKNQNEARYGFNKASDGLPTMTMDLSQASRYRLCELLRKWTHRGEKQSVRKKCFLHFFLDSPRRSAVNAAQNVELQELKSQLENGVPIESLKTDAQAKIRRFLTKTDGKYGTTYNFNDKEICRDKESNGIFAVIGYGRQSVVKKTQTAFSTYINREHIEDHFRAEKQTADGNTVRSWYGDNYMGRMIIQFVALCYEDCLWQKIKTIKQSIRNDINQSKNETRTPVQWPRE